MAKLVLFLVLACLQGVRLRSVQKRETFSKPISMKPYPGLDTTSDTSKLPENGLIDYNIDSDGFGSPFVHYADAEEYSFDTNVTDIHNIEDLDEGDDYNDSDDMDDDSDEFDDDEDINDNSAEDYTENGEFGSHNMDDNEGDNVNDSEGFDSHNISGEYNNNNDELYKEEKKYINI